MTKKEKGRHGMVDQDQPQIKQRKLCGPTVIFQYLAIIKKKQLCLEIVFTF